MNGDKYFTSRLSKILIYGSTNYFDKVSKSRQVYNLDCQHIIFLEHKLTDLSAGSPLTRRFSPVLNLSPTLRERKCLSYQVEFVLVPQGLILHIWCISIGCHANWVLVKYNSNIPSKSWRHWRCASAKKKYL